MGKLNRPIKMRSKANTASFGHNVSEDERLKNHKLMIQEFLNRQAKIDEYNKNIGVIGRTGTDLIKEFANVQLDNDVIIVQLEMENLVKGIAYDENEEIVGLTEIGHRLIDGRERNSDTANWVPNPIPVVNRGVIVAISPKVTLQYYEFKEKLAKYDPEAAESYIIPKVGDKVHIRQLLLKDDRFYLDKQNEKRDVVVSQEEFRLNFFDFTFKITPYDIEAIIK